MIRSLLLALLVALLASGAAAPALAHDARPVAATIRELPGHRYALQVRAPETVSGDNLPTIVPPASCAPVAFEEANGGALPGGSVVSCPEGLEGQLLTLRYPIYNPSLATLYRFERLEGEPVSALLPPEQESWEVPGEPGTLAIFGDYLMLGVRHIAGGFDHLLFVAGLLMIAGTWRRVLAAITGFTVAHSITLTLSALDLVRLPAAPVEAAIALSILFLAYEIVLGRRDSLTWRHPALVAATFGLLHGFGFAGVLRDIGIPQSEIGGALLAFNLGVEIGQLAFVAILSLGAIAWRRTASASWRTSEAFAGVQGNVAAGYALGTLSAFWLFERMSAFS